MEDPSLKRIEVQYFALLREQRGVAGEHVMTPARDARALFAELRQRHGLAMPIEALRVAVNESYRSWDTPICDGDRVVFIQPVAGG